MGRDFPAGPAAGTPPQPVVPDTRPDRRHRHRRPRKRRQAWYATAGAAVLAGLIAALVLPAEAGPTAAAPGRTSVASLPYWSFGAGTATVLSHRADFTEASPWLYGLSPDGRIDVQYGPGQAAAVTAGLARLRAGGLPVVPTIANITGGHWAYAPVARILHDPAARQRHIAAIVALARQHGYAGIDIDYEDLHAADRQAFTAFIGQLAAALHAHGKILSVAVFAKATGPGYGPRNAAQDYAALGRAADQVRVMAYDYHWSTSGPGPVAPVNWVREVLAYARTQIPVKKIILGIPLYGYDWSGRHGANITWQQAVRLAARHRAAIRYDAASQSPWFAYTAAGGGGHQVWFENPASTRAKLALAREAGTGGVFCWMYGGEAPGTWAALRQARQAAARGGDP